MSVNIADDETLALVVSKGNQTIDSLTVAEESTETFDVKLSHDPVSDVTVSLSLGNASTDITLDKPSLTFTTDNWSTNQTVTVRGVDDADAADESATITLSAPDVDADKTVSVTVTDNETLALVVTTPATDDADDRLTVTEGSTGTFDVKLSHAPGADVVVSVAEEEESDDISLDKTSLTFTTSNWSTNQTVTVSGVEDVDAGNESATITISLDATKVDDDKTITVTVTDDDPAALTLSKGNDDAVTEVSVTEGGSVEFDVKLATQPSAEVRVALTSDDSDVTVDKASLTFSTGNWNTNQTVRVSAGEDDDTVSESVTLGLSASGGDYGSVTKDLTVSVSDNDSPGLMLSATEVSVDEGGSVKFTVKLTTLPSGDVTVRIAQPTNTEVTVDTDPDTENDQNTLTFTTSNWNATQEVTVSAAEDADAIAEDRLTLTLSASGGGYVSVSKGIAVSVTENDTVGLSIVPATGSLSVAEGSDNTFTVALATQPSAEVRVSLTQPSNTDVTVSPATLTFAVSGVGDWKTAQTVTVSAANDADAADDEATVALAATGGDYGSVSDSVEVKVNDKETLALVVSKGNQTIDSLTVAEESTETFDVKLSHDPVSDVTVSLSLGNASTDITLDKPSLTFTTDNWSTNQTVTVRGVDDADAADESATITLSAPDVDADKTVSVTVTDNETLALVVTTPATDDADDRLTVTEGSTGTFDVKLSHAPGADVVVSVAEEEESDDISLDKTSLTFTTSNWSTNQTVTVSGVEDVDAGNESATITISLDATKVDDDKTITVTVTDDDPAALTLSKGNDDAVTEVSVTEGGSVEFDVKLATQPSAEVRVALTSDDSDVTVDKASLTFSTGNWNTNQTVRVSAGEDDDTVSESVTLGLSASGGDYGSVTKDLTVSVSDNDSPGLMLSATEVSVDEGGSVKFTVKLTTLPSGDVTVRIAQPTNTEVTVDTDPDTENDQNTLTFTTSNWNATQEVTVSAAEDADAIAEDRLTLTLSASGGGYVSVSKGIAVSVTENDTVGLSIVPATGSLSVAEGSDNTFTVALATQPSAEVRVSLTQPSNTDVTVSPATLTFAVSGVGDWKTAQTVTVSAANDADAADDEATVALAATGGDYGSVSDSVEVKVNDKETLALVVSKGNQTIDSLTVAEESTETFDVKLSHDPVSDVTVSLSLGNASTDITLDKPSLTFTTDNWSTNQTVTVRGVDDADAADESATITLSAPDVDADKTVSVTVTDNETLALVVTTPATDDADDRLTVTEGSTGTFDVKLSHAPGADVVVSVAEEEESDDISLDKTSLTFTTSNWSTNQTVTVSGVEDVDAGNESATITISLDATKVDDDKTITVTVTDDDPAALTLSKGNDDAVTEVSVTEGGSVEFDVKLATQPSAEVRVALTSDDSDVTVDKASLTFSTGNWNTNQTVRVSAGEDDDTVSESVTLGLSASGGDYGSVTKDLTVSVSDNDSPGLMLSATEVSVDEGGSVKFTVKLTTLPSGDVTVRIAQPTNTEVTVDTDPDTENDQNTLTFTTSNWNATQEVTVSAAEDADAIAEDRLTLTLSASGGGYVSVSKGIAVSVTENDTVGLSIVPATGSLSVAEGSDNTFTVALATQPSAEVRVSLTQPSNTDVTVSPATLTFAVSGVGDWKTAQTVTVSAANDADAADDEATVALAATGGDYGSVSDSVEVKVNDKETLALVVSKGNQTIDSLTVAEESTETFDVKLSHDPVSDVTVSLSLGNASTDITLDKPSLTFTTDNWSTNQTVTVRGVDDADAADESATITLSAPDVDADKTVSVTVTDNETLALVVTTPATDDADDRLTVTEGSTGTFDVKLSHAPGADVVVSVAEEEESDDISLDKTSLTFTTSNWSTNQTVTVSGVEDVDAGNESATITISLDATKVDDDKTITVTVTDDDPAALTLSKGNDDAVTEVSVTEGGSVEFDVKLATQPSAEVRVALTSDDSDVTVDKASLTFSTGNWNTNQTVRVSAGEDDDTVSESVTLGLSASGGDYGSVTKDLTVSVSDNDSPGLMLSATEVSVDEGGSVKFTVKLTTLPSGDVTVRIAQPTNTEVTVDTDPDTENDQNTLTFTTSNWNATQEVTVSAAEDADAIAEDRLTLTLSASGGGYVSVSKGIAVSVTENDTVGLSIVPATGSLSVAEGSDNTFTVALATQPSAEVRVSLTQPSNTDVTVSPATLTFAVSGVGDWKTAQTVTVSAANDADAADDEATVALAATGGDYGSVSDSVEVKVNDKETLALVVSKGNQTIDSLTVAEESTETFDVKLSHDPVSDVTVSLSLGNASTDITLDKPSLTFTTDNWSTNQTVTVRGVDDADAADESATITLSAPDVDADKTVSVTVTDNETLALVVTTPATDDADDRLTVTEGSTGTFDVKLSHAPGADVVVSVAEEEESDDISLDKTSLTFTTSNWSTNQTVTVSGVEDVDAGNESATITISLDATKVDDDKTITVTVTDDDPAALTLSKGNDDAVTEVSVTEGGSVEFDVKLATQPSAEVRVALTSDDSDVTVDKASLTFSTGNWNTNQTVRVSAGEDDDTVSESVTLGLSASGGDYGSVTKDLTVSVSDNDSPGLMLSATEVSVDEGGSVKFTVKLTTLPSGDVTVRIAQPTNTEVTVDTDPDTENDQNTLTFTTSNWNATQEVTVSAAEDADAIAEDRLTLTLSASGGGYVSVSKGIAVSVTENDTVGLSIVPATGSLSVAEGSDNTFTVALATQPSAEVRVSLTQPSNTDVTVSPATLTFAVSGVGDWKTAQTVTVSAANDADAADDEATVALAATGGDYGSVSDSVEVKVNDKETLALVVSKGNQTIDSLTVAEESTETFDVKLSHDPVSDVTVSLSLGNASTDITLDKPSLTFTTDNWSTNQTVTVRGVDDADAADESATITLSAPDVDADKTVSVTVTDNETLALVVTTPATDDADDRLTVTEGSTGTFDVKLSHAPGADVVVSVAEEEESDDISLDKTSLTFTTSNWSTNQTVTVSGVEDVDAGNESATITISLDATKVDDDKTITVTVTDDDPAALTLSKGNDDAVTEVSVTEGGSVEFDVKLATQPSAEVRVALTSDDSDVTVDKASLTFSTGNWNTNQTVRVSAGEDDDTVSERVTLTLRASGGDYDISKTLAVAVSDNDTPGLMFSVPSVSVAEGGDATFTVKLTTQPSGPVTVGIEKTTQSSGDVTVSPATLTFNVSGTGMWNQEQTVTVSAAEDEDAITDTATLRLSASNGGYDDVSKDLAVRVAENDTVGLTLSSKTLSITEGGSDDDDTLTVALATKPSASVRVTLTSSDSAVTLDKARLTFTTDNWEQTQTVKVSAAEDNDIANESATIELTASGGDYGNVSDSVAVTVNDDDTVGLTLSDSEMSVTEGASDTFTVRLATIPSGDVTVSLSGTSGTDLTLDKTRLTFTRDNWDEVQTIRVSAAEDDDGANDSATIALSASGGGYDDVSKDIEVTVMDNDTRALVLDPETLRIDEGASGNFTVKLMTRPSADVSVSLTPSASLTLDKTLLTFTTGNWEDPQTVTVSASHDNDIANDDASVSLAASGGGYQDVSDSVDVVVIDDDALGLRISSLALTIAEGESGTFTVRLTRQPTSAVQVSLTPPSNLDVTVDKTSLNFTADNWNAPQTIRVSTAHDSDDLDESETIELSASGDDLQVAVSESVSVSVKDDDTAGLVLRPTALDITEGDSATFVVRLATLPTGDVRMTLTSNNPDVSLDETLLTFTTRNWSAFRGVTVRAAEDDDTVDDSASVALTLSGGGYDDVAQTVSVSITDNKRTQPGGLESPRLVFSADEVVVAEGASSTFTVKLGTQPSENVRVSLAQPSNADVRVNKTSLTFTADNWDRAQTVQVSAVEDDDATADTATISLTAASAGSEEGDYDGITGNVQVSVTDNDTPALVLSESLLNMNEDSSDIFTVRLATRPAGEVRVVLEQPSNVDVLIDRYILIFTASNWDKEQAIAVIASHDEDTVDDRAEIPIIATGGGYANVSERMVVTVEDDDSDPVSPPPPQGSLFISGSPLVVNEGASETFMVRLTTSPTADVTVVVERPSNAYLTASPSRLTFTADDWSTPRRVTVAAAEDGGDTNEETSIYLSASGGDYYGLTGKVAVSVLDNDSFAGGLVLSAESLTLDEGGSGAFTVKLATRPTQNVKVILSQPANPDVKVDTDGRVDGMQNALIFMPSDWEEAQSVTVYAAEDEDAEDDRARVSLRASGGNYTGFTGEIAVAVMDDEESPALVLSPPTSVSVTEGDSGTFTVRLATRPSAGVMLTLTQPANAGVKIDTDPDMTGYQNQLVFTSSNWNKVQAVIVSADNDADDVGNATSVSIYAAGAREYSNVVVQVAIVTIEPDPSLSWEAKSVIPAIPPPVSGDLASLRIHCKEQSGGCYVYLDCTAQDGTIYRGHLHTPIQAMGARTVSTADIVDIVGGDWSGEGRLLCNARSQEAISTQIFTRSGDGVLVNNSQALRSVEEEDAMGKTYYQVDIESIPSPGDLNLSNIRIHCESKRDCTEVIFECYEDDGTLYSGSLGFIGRMHTRHLQTDELASMIGHRWSGMGLSCEVKSDAPLSVQVLTRTGGGRALVNNSASGVYREPANTE